MSVWFYLCLMLKGVCFIALVSFPMQLFEARWLRKRIVAGETVVFLTISYIKMIWGLEVQMVVFATTVAMVGIYLFHYLICLRGSLRERFLALVVFTAIEMVSDVISQVVMMNFVKLEMDQTWNSPSMLVVLTIGMVIFIGFECGAVAVWKFVRSSGTLKSERMTDKIGLSQNMISAIYYGSVLICIICQMLFGVFRSVDMIALGNVTSMLELAGMLLGMTGTILTIIFTFDMTRLMKMEQELFALDALRKEEEKRYQMFQREIEETAKLRHDYQNHMETVQELLEVEPQMGERLLVELYEQLGEEKRR